MAYASTAILLSAEERSALEKNGRGEKTEQRLAFRSRIILGPPTAPSSDVMLIGASRC